MLVILQSCYIFVMSIRQNKIKKIEIMKTLKKLDHRNYSLLRKSDNERFEVVSYNNEEGLIWLTDFDDNRTIISMDDLDKYKIKSLM